MNKLLALSIAAWIATSAAFAKEVQVKEHTRKDGTKVAAHTRVVKDKKETDTIEVKGYTKKDGTKVAGYTRKKTVSKSK